MYKGSIDPRKLEELLNYCVNFAKEMIQQHGEFFPFGAVINASGKMTAVGADLGEEQPQGAAVYSFLQNALKSQFQKNEILAGAIAANVNVPAQFKPSYPDGIRVHLECSGFSRFAYVPYKISNGKVDYADFISVDVPPMICS